MLLISLLKGGKKKKQKAIEIKSTCLLITDYTENNKKNAGTLTQSKEKMNFDWKFWFTNDVSRHGGRSFVCLKNTFNLTNTHPEMLLWGF